LKKETKMKAWPQQLETLLRILIIATARAFIQCSGPSNKKALLKAAVQAKIGHDERKKEQIPRQQRV
jgi:hypothetical protein